MKRMSPCPEGGLRTTEGTMKKDKSCSGRPVMVGGAKRSAATYAHGGMVSGECKKAGGMGAATKGGKFRD